MSTYGGDYFDRLLEKQGYSFYDGFYTKEEATKVAVKLRTKGYYARVLKETTAVKGYYNYAVWRKEKCNK